MQIFNILKFHIDYSCFFIWISQLIKRNVFNWIKSLLIL